MRTLKFIVDGQTIKLDPDCDFSGLIPGTEGYLRAEFSFSPEWNNTSKVAAFYSALGKEYPPQAINKAGQCMIPKEALKRKVFKIEVVGKRGEVKLKTNRVAVSQNGGNE